jgi:hypothetical protein
LFTNWLLSIYSPPHVFQLISLVMQIPYFTILIEGLLMKPCLGWGTWKSWKRRERWSRWKQWIWKGRGRWQGKLISVIFIRWLSWCFALPLHDDYFWEIAYAIIFNRNAAVNIPEVQIQIQMQSELIWFNFLSRSNGWIFIESKLRLL